MDPNKKPQKPDAFDALVGDWIGELGQLHQQVKQLPGAVAEALRPTRSMLVDAQTKLELQLASLPAAADKEAKRAGDAAISGLAGEVGRIAKNIAIQASEATAARAKIEAARWQGGMLVLGLLVGLVTAYLAVMGANALAMSTAQEKVAAAEQRAKTAEAEANAKTASAVEAAIKNMSNELLTVQELAGWLVTPEGAKVARCQVDGWRVVEQEGRKICLVREFQKNRFSEDTKQIAFFMTPAQKSKK